MTVKEVWQKKSSKLKWKMAILGISGHLAQTKILPALSEFSYLAKDLVQIRLLGYARSQVDSESIQKILLDNSPDGQNHLINLQILQGLYTDSNLFERLCLDLEEEEKLLVYLAIPPSQFLAICKNLSLHSSKPIYLLVEKPFGQNLAEAESLLEIVETYNLEQKVFFCDHYLFKAATFLTVSKREQIIKTLGEDLQEIDILLSEKETVGQRGGYYDHVGAFKDMWIHVFSLLNLIKSEVLSLSKLGVESILSDLTIENFLPLSLQLAQYEGYRQEVGSLESTTETAFALLAKWKKQKTAANDYVQVRAVTGKGLDRKETLIILRGQKHFLEWYLQPKPRLILKTLDKQVVWQEDLTKATGWQKQAVIDATTLTETSTSTVKDHTVLFEQLLAKDLGNLDSYRFVTKQAIRDSWLLFEQIQTKGSSTLSTYKLGALWSEVFQFN